METELPVGCNKISIYLKTPIQVKGHRSHAKPNTVLEFSDTLAPSSE